eukprot:3743948-Amphidinium_carterae.1
MGHDACALNALFARDSAHVCQWALIPLCKQRYEAARLGLCFLQSKPGVEHNQLRASKILTQ